MDIHRDLKLAQIEEKCREWLVNSQLWIINSWYFPADLYC